MGQWHSESNAKAESFGQFDDRALPKRKDEARGLLKRCFRNSIFSLVPFEIWRDNVSKGDVMSIIRISQTCWGFKELVDNLRELLLEYALKYRREDKIRQTSICILRCADIGDSRAMFHVGFAYWYSYGWGLKRDTKGIKWLAKSALRGNSSAMAYYAQCLLAGVGVEKNAELGNFWAKKALSSNNSFAIGYCHYYGKGTSVNKEIAFENFKLSAEEGDEYGQRWLAICFEYGYGKVCDDEQAFFWYLKSAEQGLASCQFDLGRMYRDGKGCEKNEELSKLWIQKASKQRCE